MAVGTCQHCGGEFEDRPSRVAQRKYCSHTCAAYAREKAKKAPALAAEHAHELAESAVGQEVQRQLEPIVREALTDDILEQVRALVKLVPDAIATLGRLLNDEEPAEQRHAAKTILQYTLGNSNVAPEAADGPIQINFGMPMQGEVVDAEGSVLDLAPEAAAELDRACMDCGEIKPAEEFVGASSRCQSCHDQMLAEIRERFPGMVP